MRKSIGRLAVTPSEKKLNVIVDPGIVNLTRSLIPKHFKLNRQKYPPHITVIREEDWKIDLSLHNREIAFQYDPRVVSGTTYWWLKVYSPDLLEIRRSLGLPDYSWAAKPPDGEDCFHITVGNTKS